MRNIQLKYLKQIESISKELKGKLVFKDYHLKNNLNNIKNSFLNIFKTRKFTTRTPSAFK